ncbi:hypothetical protein D3C80_1973370 [compost metagenome]
MCRDTFCFFSADRSKTIQICFLVLIDDDNNDENDDATHDIFSFTNFLYRRVLDVDLVDSLCPVIEHILIFGAEAIS